MSGLHAVQKMLADHSRAVRASVEPGERESGDPLELDLETWQVRNLANGKAVTAHPLPEFFREMTAAGGDKAYSKARIARERSARSGQSRL